MYAEPTNYDIRQFLIGQGIRFQELTDRFAIVCPYHDDHSPSAALYKDRQFFECFACGQKRFFKTMYKQMKGKSWDDGQKLTLVRPRRVSVELSTTMRKAVDFEEGVITSVYDNPQALAYARSRGIEDSFIDEFGLSATEICKINGRVWTNRLLIPVKENGQDYSLEGRDYTRTHERKCLYPKDAPIDTLFNVDNLDYTKPLVVVEGIMDLHKIWQSVYKNVTATFGIMIPAKQEELLKKHPNIILFIDDDEAGFKSVSLFEKFMQYDFKVTLVRGKDPGESTINELEVAITTAVPYGEFLIRELGMFPEKEKISLLETVRNSKNRKENTIRVR